MAGIRENDAKKPSGLNYTSNPSPETDFGNEDLGNASLAPAVSHQVNKKTPIAESKFRENSQPMDIMHFAVDARGESFGFDGQGDEAIDALEDFGATENENGTYSITIDDFKDWCETYGIDPTSEEFIITDENDEAIEDVYSFIYDVDDDIQDSDLVSGEDDDPDFNAEADAAREAELFGDDEEDYDVEDDEYWDDAMEIDPADYDPKTVKGQMNWAEAGADAEDDEEMDAHRDAYKSSYADWEASFKDAFNLKDFGEESIHESYDGRGVPPGGYDCGRDKRYDDALTRMERSGQSLPDSKSFAPSVTNLAKNLNKEPAIQARLGRGPHFKAETVTPEMVYKALEVLGHGKPVGYQNVLNYMKAILDPSYNGPVNMGESKAYTRRRMKEGNWEFEKELQPLARAIANKSFTKRSEVLNPLCEIANRLNAPMEQLEVVLMNMLKNDYGMNFSIYNLQRESKSSKNKRMKEDTQAFLSSPKGPQEREIPSWVMKAFEESKAETKMLKEWIENPNEGIFKRYDRIALYAGKVRNLASEIREAGGDEYADELDRVARDMR